MSGKWIYVIKYFTISRNNIENIKSNNINIINMPLPIEQSYWQNGPEPEFGVTAAFLFKYY